MDAGLTGATWAQAMAWTHHGEQGFSRRHQAEEHFSTSLDVGDHIARVVLERCLAAADRHRIRDPWIVDVGSGSGRLLAQLLDLGFPCRRLLGIDVREAPDLPVRWIRGVAPGCLPQVRGVLFAHEFLDDVPVEVVEDGWLLRHDAGRAGRAGPQDVAWLRHWRAGDSGVVGRYRDAVWAALVATVEVGEAIAVDYAGELPVGHRSGRRQGARLDGQTDLSAGVDLRSCRAATGGRLMPQHRVLAGRRAQNPQEAAELAVLRDRRGFGAFGWLFTEVTSVGSPA